MAKICFIVNDFPVLSETFVIRQMQGLMEFGHDVHIACSNLVRNDLINPESYPLRDLLPRATYRWAFNKILRRILWRVPMRFRGKFEHMVDVIWSYRLNRYDMIIGHFGYSGQSLAMAKSLGIFKTPMMIFYHGQDVGVPLLENGLSIYAGQLSGPDYHATVNRYFHDELLKKGALPEKVFVHHMGIDPDKFNFVERAWDKKKEKIRIVSVCRMMEKKGMQYALDAFAILSNVRPDISWTYDIVGDGPLLNDLKEKAGKLSFTGDVTFHGAMPHADIVNIMAKSDIFLLPSVTAKNGDCEGIPVVLMESMASGLLTISTYHSGIPELIENGQTGLLTPERDADAIAQQLSWAIDNPQECERIVRQARAKVLKDFNQQILDKDLSEKVIQITS